MTVNAQRKSSKAVGQARHWHEQEGIRRSKPTIALAPHLQLGTFLAALVDQEHDLVKLLLRHLCSRNTSPLLLIYHTRNEVHGLSQAEGFGCLGTGFIRHMSTLTTNLGTLLCARLEGIAHSTFFCGFRSLLYKLIIDALVHKGPGPSCAALACQGKVNGRPLA